LDQIRLVDALSLNSQQEDLETLQTRLDRLRCQLLQLLCGILRETLIQILLDNLQIHTLLSGILKPAEALAWLGICLNLEESSCRNRQA